MANKELFVNSIAMVPVDDSKNIPTVLLYRADGKILVGSAALAEAKERKQINEDFKIDLGNIDRRSLASRGFVTATGIRKSAINLTADFLYHIIDRAREWIEKNGYSNVGVMLAEPLSLQGDLAPNEWLSNYRQNLNGMLSGKKFDKIDFLPEPFAVFQYYRYGLRHPVLASRAKHIALVIDFGGGTFDVCIIESTKEGDISQTGRNARPLAANSEPVGGYYLNRLIAQHLLLNHVKTKEERARIHKGLNIYSDWRKENCTGSVPIPYTTFVDSFHSLMYEMEEPKLELCRQISNWDLDARLEVSTLVSIPDDIFASTPKRINARLSAIDIRMIFEEEIWNKRLKDIIRKTLQRGTSELNGATVSTVLLSGGSANIQWLDKLIRRDFLEQLGDSTTLCLPDYQEVVAKGLAIECTRRFHAPDGDFSSVTYNRLNLLLKPDDMGIEMRPFVPRSTGLPETSNSPGVLIPSASAFRELLDKRLEWRFKLSRPPHRHLDYYFLRSTFDPEDLNSLQNVEEHRIATPSKCPFDNYLTLQLVVSEDGTAKPVFIYSYGYTDSKGLMQNRVEKAGRAFYLDMTYPEKGKRSESYLGLDFGTSNTSISFVSAASVQVYTKRSKDRDWKDLSELIQALPYPLAEPLSRYFVQTDPARLVDVALEFFEGGMALAAYCAFVEYCASKPKRGTKIFRGLTHRAIGPLWRLLQDCLTKMKEDSRLVGPFGRLLEDDFFKIIDTAVTFFGEFKHDKAQSDNLDVLRAVQIFANVSNEVFSKAPFGFFENVTKQNFTSGHHGFFRIGSGVQPFYRSLRYVGEQSFSPDEPFVVDTNSGDALSLQPLIFWDQCGLHRDHPSGHCYIYDIPQAKGSSFKFKAVGSACTLDVTSEGRYARLFAQIKRFQETDPELVFRKIEGLTQVDGE